MRNRLRSISRAIGCLALCVSSAGPLFADDGPSLYKQLCASCHDAGTERAPNREALLAMSPERVLSALESGPMLSMASGRTGTERRALAEFVAGKSFAQAVSTTPSPQAMCRATAGGPANLLAGPLWNGWGVNTANTRFQDGAAAGFAAADVPRLKLKWAFGFPGELSVDAQPTIAGGRVLVGTQSGVVYSLNAATGCVHWFFQAASAVRAAVSIGRVSTPYRTALPGVHRRSRRARVRRRCRNRRAGLENDGGRSCVRPRHRVAGLSRRPAVCRRRVRRRDGRSDGRLPVLPIPRQPGRAQRRHGTTGLEDVHDRRRGLAEVEEQRRHAVVGPIGRAHLVEPGHRRQTKRDLRHHRKQLHRSAHADERCVRRVRPQIREAALVPTDDGGGRLERVLSSRGESQLHERRCSGLRLCVAAHAGDARQRAARPRRRAEIRNGPCGRSRSRGANHLAGSASARAASTAACSGARPPTSRTSTWRCPTSAGSTFPAARRPSRIQTSAAGYSRFVSTPASRSGIRRRRPAARENAAARLNPRRSALIPGVAFSGSVDGHLRAYSATDGAILWDFDTIRTYDTVNGVPGRGGSLNVAGPAISGGTLFVDSGYVQNGTPGNVLLAFSVDGK